MYADALLCILIPFLLFLAQVAAQSTFISGTFSGAIYVTGQGLATAVQAQCPADHPQRCDAIQQPNYCCGTGAYCAMASGNVVGCCPNGQTCSGAIGAPVATYYTTTYPTTYQTTYQTTGPVTVVITTYVTNGFVAPGGYVTTMTVYTTNTQNTPNTQPCSTLTANGPGLPTTRAGGCGNILIVAAANKNRLWVGWIVCLCILISYVVML